jgi:hypothetical protein
MTNQEKTKNTTIVSTTLPSFRQVLDYSKSHRIKVTDANGKTWVNLSLLVSAILTLIMPEIVALLVIVAVIKGASVDFIDTEADETSITTS